MSKLTSFPAFQTNSKYSYKKFLQDLLAGVTIAVVTVPQGMAYSLLAGLDAIYGLYTACIAMLLYPFFGSSRTLIVGPVALIAITIFSGVSQIENPGSDYYLSLVILVTFMSGIIQILMSLFHLGDLSKLLAKPVMSGFISAAGIIVIISQLKYIFGIEIPRTDSIPEMIIEIFRHLKDSNTPSVILGVGSLIIIRALRLIYKRFPGALITLIGGTILVFLLQWNLEGVSVVGSIPSGPPNFSYSFLDWSNVTKLFPTAIVISLLCFIGSYSIAEKSEEGKVDNHIINSNRELFALGMVKVIGSFFYNFAATGSFSRTAIADESSANSGAASISASLIVGAFILFFSQILFYIPVPVLAAIVISSVLGLIDFGTARELFLLDRRDFWVWLATFLLTLLIGIQNGVFAGIILSFIFLIGKISKPDYSIMGKIPNSNIYRNVERFDYALTREDLLILRIDADILFVNADQILVAITNELSQRPSTEILIIDISGVNNIDGSGLRMLENLRLHVVELNIELFIVGAKGTIRDLLKENGFYQDIGSDHFFPTTPKAMAVIDARN